MDLSIQNWRSIDRPNFINITCCWQSISACFQYNHELVQPMKIATYSERHLSTSILNAVPPANNRRRRSNAKWVTTGFTFSYTRCVIIPAWDHSCKRTSGNPRNFKVYHFTHLSTLLADIRVVPRIFCIIQPTIYVQWRCQHPSKYRFLLST